MKNFLRFLKSVIGWFLAVLFGVVAVYAAFDGVQDELGMILACALVLGIAGGVVLILETHTIYVLAWLFGIALIVYGVYSLFHCSE